LTMPHGMDAVGHLPFPVLRLFGGRLSVVCARPASGVVRPIDPSTLPLVYEPQVRRPRQRIGDVFAGAGYLGRGLGWVARGPGQWLFGLIPAVITLILFGFALYFLGKYADELGEWVTPFADDWSQGLRSIVRVVAALAIFGTGAFLAMVLFTAVTLLIGEPF